MIFNISFKNVKKDDIQQIIHTKYCLEIDLESNNIFAKVKINFTFISQNKMRFESRYSKVNN